MSQTGRVNILEKNKAPFRKIDEQGCKALLVGDNRGKADDVDAHAEVACESKTERTLASTGRTVEEVPAAVRDSTVGVPAARSWVEIITDIVHKVLLNLLTED